MWEGDRGRRGQQGEATPKLRGSWNKDAPQTHQDFCSQVPVPCPACVCECDLVCVTLPSASSDRRGAEMGSDNCPTSGLP